MDPYTRVVLWLSISFWLKTHFGFSQLFTTERKETIFFQNSFLHLHLSFTSLLHTLTCGNNSQLWLVGRQWKASPTPLLGVCVCVEEGKEQPLLYPLKSVIGSLQIKLTKDRKDSCLPDAVRTHAGVPHGEWWATRRGTWHLVVTPKWHLTQ